MGKLDNDLRTAGTTATKVTIVTHYIIMVSNPTVLQSSRFLSQYTSRLVYSLSETIWMIQRRTGRRRSDETKIELSATHHSFREKNVSQNTTHTAKHGGGNIMQREGEESDDWFVLGKGWMEPLWRLQKLTQIRLLHAYRQWEHWR